MSEAEECVGGRIGSRKEIRSSFSVRKPHPRGVDVDAAHELREVWCLGTLSGAHILGTNPGPERDLPLTVHTAVVVHVNFPLTRGCWLLLMPALLQCSKGPLSL